MTRLITRSPGAVLALTWATLATALCGFALGLLLLPQRLLQGHQRWRRAHAASPPHQRLSDGLGDSADGSWGEELHLLGHCLRSRGVLLQQLLQQGGPGAGSSASALCPSCLHLALRIHELCQHCI